MEYRQKDLHIKAGHVIAQLIIELVSKPCFFEIEQSQLSVTLRGCQGFGSTGV